MRTLMGLLGLAVFAGCPAPDDTDPADTDPADTDVADTDTADTDIVDDTDLSPGTITISVALDDSVVCSVEEGDCVGDLYGGVFPNDPTTGEGGEPVTFFGIEGADLSGDAIVMDPSASVAAGTYYAAAFMDENGTGNTPDDGDLVVNGATVVEVDGDIEVSLTLFRLSMN